MPDSAKQTRPAPDTTRHTVHVDDDVEATKTTTPATDPKDRAARDSNRESREAAGHTLRSRAARIDFASEVVEHIVNGKPNPSDPVRRGAVKGAHDSVRKEVESVVAFCDGLGFDKARWKTLPEIDVLEAAVARFNRAYTSALGIYDDLPTETNERDLAKRLTAFRAMTGSTPGALALAHEPTGLRADSARVRLLLPELEEAIDATVRSVEKGNYNQLPRLVQLVRELVEQHPYASINDRATYPLTKAHFDRAFDSLRAIDRIPAAAGDAELKKYRDALGNCVKP